MDFPMQHQCDLSIIIKFLKGHRLKCPNGDAFISLQVVYLVQYPDEIPQFYGISSAY